MPLSLDEVRRIAALARIEIDASEAEAVAHKLQAILALVGELQAADTRGIEPMAHPADAAGGGGLRLREDRVTETERRTLYQSVAPQVEQGLYLVPKVIE